MAFVRSLNAEARWGLGLLALIVLLGIVVPLLSPYGSVDFIAVPLSPPSLDHPFGTDQLGRDVFTRTFEATRLDILLALAGVSVPLLVGTLLGGLFGTTRASTISTLWMMLIDAINAFPFTVLVIAIVAAVGTGVQGLLIALATTNWARYAKIARARALTLREQDFIHAAHILGYSPARILIRHVLPNVYSETLAYGLSDFVLVIITVAGLSFLGVGVHPPAPEWGAMMADGRLFLSRQPWLTVFPGLILSLTAIGVALLAQGVMSVVRGED